MKKEVLIAASVFPPEPIVSASLMANLAEELSKTFDVTVLRPSPTRPKGFIMPEYDTSELPYKVIQLRTYTNAASSIIGRFRESMSMGRVYSKYIKKHHQRIDLIINDAWHLFGYNKVARAAVKYGIPYIVTVQDIYPESLASKLPDIKWLRAIVMMLLGPIDHYTQSHAVKIHTISDKMRAILSATRNIPEDRYLIVRNWQDERPFLAVPDATEDQLFVFMYCGNVGPLAGVDTIMDAFAKAAIPNSKLVIAGSGSARAALEEKGKKYSNSQIEFWDVPAGKVPEIQAKANVMLLPVKKGFAMSSIPSKLPAYMFSSKPVLASVDAESDTAKCILDAQAGWVCEPENVNGIASLMREIAIMDKNSLKEKGAAGCNYALKLFSRTENLQILVSACKAIMV